MKIAVASIDGVTISRHFGRSKCFLVFEIEADQISSETLRQNVHTAHAKGGCGGRHDHDHDHSGHHDHSDIANGLSDCDVVLCYGMGRPAADALRAGGTEPFIVDGDVTPRQAAELYVAGQLKAATHFCRCH